MHKLSIKRFIQEPSCCAIAACASVGNYYNKNVNYKNIKALAENMLDDEVTNGLYTGEIANLLNLIGFKSVRVISTNMKFLDYSFVNLTKKSVIEKLNYISRLRGKKIWKENIKSYISFLSNTNYNNELIIDYRFGKYIREHIRKNMPVILSFDWTIFFRFSKQRKGKADPFKGDTKEHAVVVYGFDKKYAYILDSHSKFYKYKLKKYKNGFYEIKWEELMTVIGQGDIIVPCKYSKKRMYKL